MSHPKRRRSDLDAARTRRRIFWLFVGIVLLTIAFLIILVAGPSAGILWGIL